MAERSSNDLTLRKRGIVDGASYKASAPLAVAANAIVHFQRYALYPQKLGIAPMLIRLCIS